MSRVRKPVILPRVKPCSDCPTLITAKANRCAPCNRAFLATDPAVCRKRSDSVSRFFRENPAKASENARSAAAARMAKPSNREKARATMQAIQRLSWTPEAIARRDYEARAAKRSDTLLAWCPKAYRPLYAELMKARDMRAAYAKEVVLGQIAADAKRAKSALQPAKPVLTTESPFERQERAMRQGAALQDNVPVTLHSPAASELRAKLA